MLSRSRICAPHAGQAERGGHDGLTSRDPVDHHIEERSDRETEQGTQPDQQSKHGNEVIKSRTPESSRHDGSSCHPGFLGTQGRVLANGPARLTTTLIWSCCRVR